MRPSTPIWALVACACVAISPAAHAAPLTRGFAVVALDGAHDAAVPLGRAVYSRPSLRPDASLDEARAHVLLGEPAPSALADLAAIRSAIHGDDAPTRQLLTNIAADFHLRGIVVVSCDPAAEATPSTWYTPQASDKNAPTCVPVGRLFVAATANAPAHFAIDASRPDTALDSAQPVTWNTAVLQLDAQYGDHVATTPKSAPAGAIGATAPAKESSKKGHSFYESPWFWGALGAAAFAGAAVFLATRDSSSDTTHLQMTVP